VHDLFVFLQLIDRHCLSKVVHNEHLAVLIVIKEILNFERHQGVHIIVRLSYFELRLSGVLLGILNDFLKCKCFVFAQIKFLIFRQRALEVKNLVHEVLIKQIIKNCIAIPYSVRMVVVLLYDHYTVAQLIKNQGLLSRKMLVFMLYHEESGCLAESVVISCEHRNLHHNRYEKDN
jgi:hypothetical protein